LAYYENDISAKKKTARQGAWIQTAHEQPQRKKNYCQQAQKRKKNPDCIGDCQ